MADRGLKKKSSKWETTGEVSAIRQMRNKHLEVVINTGSCGLRATEMWAFHKGPEGDLMMSRAL